jgi:6-phosphogluconolactonase
METVHRYADAEHLARGVARTLLDRLIDLQEGGRVATLCLTGGRIANSVYTELAGLVEGSGLNTGLLELWWGDERFVPTDDPIRNAGPTLGVLAGRFPLDPARTHPMPAADGLVDNASSAATYAKELDDTVFDVCLLGMGTDGHVASLFPGHPSFEERAHTVIGVNDAPVAPAERISLTVPALNRSREVWYLVVGAEKTDAVRRSVAGETGIPAGVVRGSERTRWLLDQAAAADLPYHACEF